jgi:LysM repeat protein
VGKAYLEFEEWTAGSAGTPKRRIEFQFNPDQFSVKRTARWVKHDGSTTPEYVGPRAQQMSVKMFLDATHKENGDVSGDVATLMDACRPTSDSVAKNQPLPPKVRFGWDRVHFEGYVEDVDVEYQLFQPDGRPIRALCTISLQETSNPPDKQNPTSGTRTIHRTVEVVAGDTLPGLAYREYGSPARWRAIAELNAIDDPLRLSPGTQLLVPTSAEAAEST